MKRTVPLTVLSLLLALCVSGRPAATAMPAAQPAVTIPFELATRHIIVKGTVNGSRPLSFVLDTGADKAIIRMDIAKELGLRLDGTVNAGGAGGGTQTGQFVRDATWSLVGLEAVKQPVTLALPLAQLAAAMGHDADGIIGGEFIRRFVLEVDYQARTLQFHPPSSFSYTGSGQALPMEFDANNHPVLAGIVTPVGGSPIPGRFTLDLGSGGALILHSPFVAEHGLPRAEAKTIPAVGAGAGGRTTGRLGRSASLQLGSFTLNEPFTMFSQDTAGAFANAALAGNIGAQIASRFRMFLDYGRRRIILEPSPTFKDPFDRASSGLVLRASGADYRTFRVAEVLEASPATDAGIKAGDMITAINGAPAARLTLTEIMELFDKAVPYQLMLRRGGEVITVTLTPRKMI
jgi:hypothetical protein